MPAYENLLKSRRQVLHRRVGEVLRDQFAASAAVEPELLAHHFSQAALPEAAIEWWGKAGTALPGAFGAGSARHYDQIRFRFHTTKTLIRHGCRQSACSKLPLEGVDWRYRG